MASLSAHEQFLLELVNRARMDPSGEASRYGIRLNKDLPPGTLTGTVSQPLAPNEFLRDAAHEHSTWMLDKDRFSHTGIGGSQSWDRMSAAGYTFEGTWNAGENIAWLGSVGSINAMSYILRLHQNLFLSPDHRFMMLKPEFREMGPGIAMGKFTKSGTNYNAVMATENFAQSGDEVFVTGVTIRDRDGDDFYDIGEGRSGIVVRLSKDGITQGTTKSAAAGGYGVEFSGGDIDVAFSGGDLAHSVHVEIHANNKSAKVDLAGTNAILSSVSAKLGDGAVRLVLLGASATTGKGNDGNNVLIGNRAANRLDGDDGADVLIGRAGRDVLTGGAGADRFDFNAVIELRSLIVAADHVTDFESGVDRIDLWTIDAKVNATGNQSFKWIGTSAFHHVEGELRLVYSGSDVVVSGDVNGDGRADFRIILDNVAMLSKADFIL